MTLTPRIDAIEAKIGVVDGSAAVAGEIGEYLEATANVSGISNGVPTNITSLSLTPGDWEISGSLDLNGLASTHHIKAVINKVNADVLTGITRGLDYIVLPTDGTDGVGGGTVGPLRVSLVATTTMYLNTETASGAGTSTIFGSLRARRVR